MATEQQEEAQQTASAPTTRYLIFQNAAILKNITSLQAGKMLTAIPICRDKLYQIWQGLVQITIR